MQFCIEVKKKIWKKFLSLIFFSKLFMNLKNNHDERKKRPCKIIWVKVGVRKRWKREIERERERERDRERERETKVERNKKETRREKDKKKVLLWPAECRVVIRISFSFYYFLFLNSKYTKLLQENYRNNFNVVFNSIIQLQTCCIVNCFFFLFLHRIIAKNAFHEKKTKCNYFLNIIVYLWTPNI
jgi:hypothetical protein